MRGGTDEDVSKISRALIAMKYKQRKRASYNASNVLEYT